MLLFSLCYHCWRVHSYRYYCYCFAALSGTVYNVLKILPQECTLTDDCGGS
jgi:hypothetical protein